METQRAYQYARCAAVLAADLDVPGQEATYDQALTNGLVAIVARQWPGQEQDGKGFVFPAAALLRTIADRAVAQPDGTHLVEWTDAAGRPGATRVDTAVLREGIGATQASRHGRAAGALERRHVDALLALDSHPALGRIREVESDSQWLGAEIRDRYDQQRAADYLAFIGDDEAARRAERAPDLAEPYHPKHNPDREGTELELCRVCGYSAFKLRFPAEFPDTGFGACLVCSYARSADVSYYLALTAQIAGTLPTD
ncbi:hypothetical protein [Kitasatospora sp. NPDC088134]|uniref:hypothetical protein n=1 Tax=Kitasatospora sp. NPDC088134 TaxID=3364071 RepID=UPI0038294424